MISSLCATANGRSPRSRYRSRHDIDADVETVCCRRRPVSPGSGRSEAGSPAHRDGPTGLLAELTHRCPLHCEYCSNPPDAPTARGELDQAEWSRVLSEAAALGVLQVHFSGGEPLLRPDLPELIAAARAYGLYTNLITSGLGLNRAMAGRLRAAGLDHAQISFQADEPALADAIAGVTSHRRKLDAARSVADEGIALNDSTSYSIAPTSIAFRRSSRLAESLGAGRIELAHAQYYGWACRNRARLIPTREQSPRRRRSSQRRPTGCGGGSKSFMSSPTTSAIARSRA